MPIVVDILSLHFDADLWGPVDPNEFYPERFAVKRNPLSFMAFGNGPRNCVGMKFALIELKMAMVKLLQSFEFDLVDKEKNLELNETNMIRTPKDGVKVILRKKCLS